MEDGVNPIRKVPLAVDGLDAELMIDEILVSGDEKGGNGGNGGN